MKLDNDTASKMQEQIGTFLFIQWLEGGLWGTTNPEIQELYRLYHDIMIKQIAVVHE